MNNVAERKGGVEVGYPRGPVNLSRLLEVHRACAAAPVKYRLGAKWDLRLGLNDILRDQPPVDCSGYVRWLLYKAGLWLPDGSQTQWAYVRDVLQWRAVEYKNLRYTEADPTRLFIAFKKRVYRAGQLSAHGHVWLVHAGATIESASGLKGVGSRPWRHLYGMASACYEVPVARRGKPPVAQSAELCGSML